MWEVDHKEDWAQKNWCFWTVVLEKSFESPLDSKGMKPVNPKETNSEYSLEELMLKLELQYSDHLIRRADTLENTQHIGKDPDAGKGWEQEERGVTADEMVAWHHQISGHEFEQILGDREGQSSLECCTVHGVAKSWSRLSDWTTGIWEVDLDSTEF